MNTTEQTIIFHIDVNSAFLSWSAIAGLQKGETTDLRTIPAIVGGDLAKRHGVVLAKSIPAKAFGIRTGEPVTDALRKCPGLTIVPPDHHLYHEKSKALMAFLSDICPDIEQVSVDECYMDFTPIAYRYPDPVTAANRIRNQVREAFGFTVNVGVSDRKVLAKMASDFRKPDLVHTLFHTEIREKMWPLPVSSLYMCGHSSVQALHNLGILTIGDLAQADVSILTSHLKSHGRLLWEFANGIDASRVETEASEMKGIGNSTTMEKDAETMAEIRACLLTLAESVSTRLRAAGMRAGMVSVEIKYSSFQSVSHQTTLSAPSDTCNTIYETACALAAQLWDSSPVRLLGIRTSKLTAASAPVQMSIFDLPAHQIGQDSAKQKELEQALDAIRLKYGKGAVVRGSLLNAPTSGPKHTDPHQ